VTRRFVTIAVASALGLTACAAEEARQPAQVESTSTATATEPAETSTPAKKIAKPTATPKPVSKKTQLRWALGSIDAGGYVGEMKLVDATISQGSVEATFKTPEGGFEGASPEDLDTASGAVFRTVYGKVKYPTDGVVVVFKGGLTNTATGKDLPDEGLTRSDMSPPSGR
jgi:hypothetical protein